VRLRAVAAWALVALWTAWAFAPLLGGYFLADDFVVLALFGHWEEQGRFAAALAGKFVSGLDAGESHFYRPLPYAAYALNYVTSGIAAAPWIAMNIAVHILNAVLVAIVAAMLADAESKPRATAAGAAAAALFLFYAPSAEVVAWISARPDSFATFFTLLACAFFLRSRGTGDVAWWLSLFSAVAAMLSKESAAVVPFAILVLAWFRAAAIPGFAARCIAALRAAAPWIVLAIAYLAWRRYMFGSALTVYHSSRPVAALMLEGDYWRAFAASVPPWYSAQFRSATWYPVLGALTVAQLAVVAAGWPAERRARDALVGSAAIFAVTLVLLAPHVSVLRPDGHGGRLIYQSAAFFAIFAAAALALTRRHRVLWTVTLVLVVLHAALQVPVLGRWLQAYAQMRELVVDVARVHRESAPGAYTLLLAPAELDDIVFALHAQAGVMVPPVQREVLSHRLLVQIYDEVPELAGKLKEGIVPFFRQRSLFDYLNGDRIAAALEYPTAVVCWDPGRRHFVPLEVAPGPSPEEYARAVQRALDASRCSAYVKP
jgi:hypothetical protein